MDKDKIPYSKKELFETLQEFRPFDDERVGLHQISFMESPEQIDKFNCLAKLGLLIRLDPDDNSHQCLYAVSNRGFAVLAGSSPWPLKIEDTLAPRTPIERIQFANKLRKNSLELWQEATGERRDRFSRDQKIEWLCADMIPLVDKLSVEMCRRTQFHDQRMDKIIGEMVSLCEKIVEKSKKIP